MNQHQRKFLLDQLEKQFQKEYSELKDRKPKEPSLNNYLIAAVLDGSAEMRDMNEIRDFIRARVRDLGKADSLVDRRERWGAQRETEDTINLPAEVLFRTPKAFVEVRDKYEKAKQAWDDECEALQSSMNALRIKVQVGSDAALESLVDQADQICSISLVASSKLILRHKQTLEITNG